MTFLEDIKLKIGDEIFNKIEDSVEKEGKIIQNGKTGKSVFYSKN